jgi:hypothetical protein
VTDAKPHRHRFPMVIIQQAVWLYHRFPLSYRDVQELMHEHGIQVSHETLHECFGQNGRRTRRLPVGVSSSDLSSLKTCATGNPDGVPGGISTRCGYCRRIQVGQKAHHDL